MVDAGDAVVPRSDATGFTFAQASAPELLAGLDRACDWFASQHGWQRMQRTAMERDSSWDAAAIRYLDLYYDLLADFESNYALSKRHVA